MIAVDLVRRFHTWQLIRSAHGWSQSAKLEEEVLSKNVRNYYSPVYTRAIHTEIIEQLSSSYFINLLRLFVALHEPVTQFRSGRGTIFVGATEDLSIKDKILRKFNPPYVPDMDGVWERLIGKVKRIMNAMILQNQRRNLTH